MRRENGKKLSKKYLIVDDTRALSFGDTTGRHLKVKIVNHK